MTHIRLVLVAWALALAVAGPAQADVSDVLCTSSAGACQPAARTGTPITAPVGPHLVGRTDIAVPAGPRTVMVSAWYPAAGGGRAALYVPTSTTPAALHVATDGAMWMHAPAAAVAMATASAPATQDAPFAEGLDRLPVAVLSPGMGTPRWILSGAAADLASRGYIALVVDHTGESPAVELTDGTIVTGTPPRSDDPGYMRAALATRVDDVRLVLDHLGDLPLVGAHTDATRIVAVGHSYGGYTAVATMQADPRVRAGVVLDGSAGWPGTTGVENQGLDRPVLVLAFGSMVHASWIKFGHNTTGPFRLATTAGGGHYSPTDLCTFAPEAGELCGTLPARRATTITRELTATFLDQALTGQPDALGEWPEVDWRR
ncbi:alpha/beta hydrolase family protein [Nocardia wallacei]|uniref:alpha/beta hydrolase family protein n=1 Tax=Nocardia wallacei TaxID=480035 RepID=UPI002458E57A|nr:prolyl oligopeptidase family serine peptidase [Nocardia wallacei]